MGLKHTITLILLSPILLINGQNIDVSDKTNKDSKNIQEWLSILPDRYLTFECEATERQVVLDNPSIVDSVNQYICSGQPQGDDIMPGTICYSLRSYPYNEGELLVITNEKFDYFCTEFDHFFLQYTQDKKWIEIPLKELFEVDIWDHSIYYPEGKVPEVYQFENTVSTEFMLKLDSSQSIHIGLQICYPFDEGGEQRTPQLPEDAWDNLKILEFIWNQNKGKFILKD